MSKKIEISIRLLRALVPVKSWRNRLRRRLNEVKYERVIEVCRQYLSEVTSSEEGRSAYLIRGKPKIIWQCWLQGDADTPDAVKVCFDSVRKHAPEYERVILTRDNIGDYVKIPRFIAEKYDQGLLSPAHYSDVLRVYLLSEHGGIWIDATVLLTGSIPTDIQVADFFMFQNPNRYSLTIAANWFIVSAPHHPLIEMMKSFLTLYLREHDEMINYFLVHFFFTEAVRNNDRYKMLFQQIPFHSKGTAHLLQKQMAKKCRRRKVRTICRKSSIHKMTHKGHLYDLDRIVDG